MNWLKQKSILETYKNKLENQIKIKIKNKPKTVNELILDKSKAVRDAVVASLILDVLSENGFASYQAIPYGTNEILDKLVDHENFEYRLSAAKQGYGLDKLIYDTNKEIREIAATGSGKSKI